MNNHTMKLLKSARRLKCIFSKQCPQVLGMYFHSGTPKLGSDDSHTVKEKSGDFHSLMRHVPQPVVVVTTAKMLDGARGRWLKRGVTCSSFTSVSINPPIISFCMKMPSRMNNLLEETKRFAVHILNKNQVKYGLHFSKPVQDGMNQFHLVPHELNRQGIPVICGAAGVLHCTAHSVHNVGDHSVWYGNVTQTNLHESDIQPLLYFKRSFRSVGDEAFMTAFEERTLPFEDWTHEAHLRMAWNYIMKYGDQAEPYIKNGIQRYNEQNKHLISTGYHETITKFYIHMVTHAINISNNSDMTFEEFLTEHPYLTDRSLMFEYYSKESITNKEAAQQFVEPDIQQLP